MKSWALIPLGWIISIKLAQLTVQIWAIIKWAYQRLQSFKQNNQSCFGLEELILVWSKFKIHPIYPVSFNYYLAKFGYKQFPWTMKIAVYTLMILNLIHGGLIPNHLSATMDVSNRQNRIQKLLGCDRCCLPTEWYDGCLLEKEFMVSLGNSNFSVLWPSFRRYFDGYLDRARMSVAPS